MAQGEDRICFAVGVFLDVEWAERGIEALQRKGFPSECLSIVAKHTPAVAALVEKTLGTSGDAIEVKGLGASVALGPLHGTLQGSDDGLGRTGVAATMRRAGFQAHDGFIYETLTARGGVLVAIESEPRAADALAVLHAYGGGNAAIGAWTGRV